LAEVKIWKQRLAPIRALLFSQPESGVRCDVWLTTGQCLHFCPLSGLFLKHYVTNMHHMIQALTSITVREI